LSFQKEVIVVGSNRIQTVKVWPVPKRAHLIYYSEWISFQKFR